MIKHLKKSSNFKRREFNDTKTMNWYYGLSSIAVFNILVWIHTYTIVMRSTNNISTSLATYQQSHLMLSCIYVFVCAYRSFYPRVELERYCLFDSWASSMFLGRLAATVAELCFTGQIALCLYNLGKAYNHPITQFLSLFLVPIIAVAQGFCWCGVVTLNNLYHAVEESIWAISSMFVATCLINFVYHNFEDRDLVLFGSLGSFLCSLFFIFMVTIDVPMYLRRWRHGKQVGAKRFEVLSGIVDSLDRRVVTANWSVWKEESIWLTGYFSSAVWVSLLLIRLPIAT